MTENSHVPAAARPYLAERPIRRFRLRARHLHPLAPGWVRSFMACWHTVARERVMYKVRRHPYHWTQAGEAAHYFAMLHRAKCHLAAEYLWWEGSVMPDPISDDPAARRAWEVAKERFDAIHQVNKASLDEAGSLSRF
jgi:hypothetical protein